MRIAHLNQDAGIGPGRRKGAAVHLEAMRQAFRRCGAELVAVDAPAETAARAALERAHAEGQLDLIYERHALGAFAGSEFAAAHGVPLALEVNAPLAEEERRYRGSRLAARDPERERRLFMAARLVVAVSSAVARYAMELGADPARVRICPNAVDAEVFRPRSPGDAFHRRLVPPGCFVLGFHGRLRPWHGFRLLVEATARLLERGRPVHLLVVGEGAFAEHLRGRLPEGAWTLLGWVPHHEVPRYVACFDALPLTYGAEAPDWFSPLKLMEGMAAGVVPVVPMLGDLPQCVGDGDSGLLYPAGELEALVGCIELLVDRPDLHRSLACKARERARRHSWEGVARMVLEECGQVRT